MALEVCKDITPEDENNLISKLLQKLDGLTRLINLIYAKIEEVKNKYITKLNELLAKLLDFCPPPLDLSGIISIRNRLVEGLNNIYKVVNRLSNVITGVSNFLNAILLAIKVGQGIITGALLVAAFTPIIPASILSKLTAAYGTSSETIKKFQFKADGEQKLIPIIASVNSAAVSIQLFANTLKNFMCKLEALDFRIVECGGDSKDLVPLDTELIEFVTSTEEANQASTINTSYKGFLFEIEEVPFSSTVNRIRALAKNSEGITLLQTELSFTTEPYVLIQELQLVIDRDNLRAE